METKLLTAMDETADEAIKQAAAILKSGGLVAVPTETVYGLAASAFSESAIRNIYKAKGRPSDNPLIVHIAEMEELEGITSQVSPLARQCMAAFWPGPFTAVLPKSERIPSVVSGGLNTVAVRMPDHAVTRAIIRAAGLPLAAPSANRSGSPSPSTAAHVIEDLGGRIDAVVVSTDCAVGVESTVVTFATQPPRLLRPGGVTAEQLRRLIPDLVIDPAVTAEPEQGAQVASPGMKYKHYAPKATVILAEGSIKAFRRYANRHADAFDLVLCYAEEKEGLPIPYLSLGAIQDHAVQAERLFSLLREIDHRGFRRVLVHAPARDGMGLAVYNRLIRAAGFQIVCLPKLVGLTGPSGTGKSTLSPIAEQAGFTVIDCDRIAATVTDDPALLKRLESAFGDVVRDGRLDRKALADRAFASAGETERLNRIMLPVIVEKIEQEIDRHMAEGKLKILLDAPTLYESGLDAACDTVVAVLARPELRAARIKARDGLTPMQLKKRLNAAKSDAFYLEKAAYIIHNNGDLKAFTAAAETFFRSV